MTMRMISKEAAAALFQGRPFSRRDTQVSRRLDGGMNLVLHGSTIASLRGGTLILSLKGQATRQCMDRLRAVLWWWAEYPHKYRIYKADGRVYLHIENTHTGQSNTTLLDPDAEYVINDTRKVAA